MCTNQDHPDEIIFAYTREQAIEDGVLIDVSATAKEAGIRFPTAVTSAVWGSYVAVPPAVPWQDEKGRLWDVLWMMRVGIQRAGRPAIDTLVYQLLVQNDEGPAKEVTLKAVCGPGDKGEPVLTIMLPDED